MMAVLLAITIGGVYVGSAVIARHRAQAAADLTAVAAAVRLGAGTSAGFTLKGVSMDGCGRINFDQGNVIDTYLGR
jgi:uncharacterized membrane protein